jgi:FSR family fosmidomycin resistance protein-like MFS transporter
MTAQPGEIEAKTLLMEKSPEVEESFDTPTVATISAGHFIHDIYPAFLGPLLPIIIKNLGISLAEAGGLATVYRASSLFQPFLGLLADRTDMRYLVVAAPTVTALSMSLLGIAPDYLTLALLLAVSGLSSAAFHPPAAASITRSSGRNWGRGSSLYMFGGEMGRSVGPMFIVSIITYVGLQYSYFAAIPGVIASALLFSRMRTKRRTHVAAASVRAIWESMKVQRRPLLLLSGLILFRSTSIQSIATFYAIYLTNRGSSLMYAGFALSMYELAGACGALFGGTLSDRIGRKKMMLVSQILAGPLLWIALGLPDGTLGIVVLAIAGALALSASPVQLTLAQELMPGARSTAAGIVIFLGFEGTLVSTLVVGVVADWIGIGPALGFAVIASMLSIPFTLALPETKQARN